jgi:prevent-host-death family protein
MHKATISEIKNQLSAYIKKVRAGEPVLIVDRNQPVARLERVSTDTHPDERLTRLERDGLLQRSNQSIPMEALKRTPPKAERSVLDALLEERRGTR